MTLPNFLKNIELEPISYDAGPLFCGNGGLVTDEAYNHYFDCKYRRVRINKILPSEFSATKNEKVLNIWRVEDTFNVLSKDLKWIHASSAKAEEINFASPEEAFECYKQFLNKVFSDPDVPRIKIK